jgi:hypothetical protein
MNVAPLSPLFPSPILWPCLRGFVGIEYTTSVFVYSIFFGLQAYKSCMLSSLFFRREASVDAASI